MKTIFFLLAVLFLSACVTPTPPHSTSTPAPAAPLIPFYTHNCYDKNRGEEIFVVSMKKPNPLCSTSEFLDQLNQAFIFPTDSAADESLEALIAIYTDSTTCVVSLSRQENSLLDPDEFIQVIESQKWSPAAQMTHPVTSQSRLFLEVNDNRFVALRYVQGR